MEGNGWENLPGQTAGQVLPVDAGLIPRCVQAIFSDLQSIPEENYTVKCSFMEIYNEELSDLLSPGKAQVLVQPFFALHCGSDPPHDRQNGKTTRYMSRLFLCAPVRLRHSGGLIP